MVHSLPSLENIICLRLRDQNTDWEEVLHLAVRSEAKKGAIIPSIKNNGFYYIKKGCVRLERLFASGDGQIALFFEKGSFFAEITSILYPNNTPEDTSTFFHVQEDSILYKFPSYLLKDKDFIQDYPHLITSILHSVAHKSALLLRNGTTNVMHTPEERICRTLLYLSSQAQGALVFKPKMTQAELGMALGIPRSTLCRALARLRMKGILGSFTPSKVEILDFKALQKLASLG